MNGTQTGTVPADDGQSYSPMADKSVADSIFDAFSDRLERNGLFSGITEDLVKSLRADPLKTASVETLLRKKSNEDS